MTAAPSIQPQTPIQFVFFFISLLYVSFTIL